MSDQNSIDDFVDDVIQGVEAGDSLVVSPTLATQRSSASLGGHLGALPGHAVDKLIARGGTVWSVAPHPTRPHVFAMVDSRPRVTLVNVVTSERLLEFTPAFEPLNPGACEYCITISPDGGRIAVGRKIEGQDIVIHREHDGKRVGGWAAPSSRRIMFSSDGGLLLQFENDRETVGLWDAGTGVRLWTYAGQQMKKTGGFVSQSQEVFIQDAGMRSTLIHVPDGIVVRDEYDAFDIAAPSADGKVIALGNRYGKIKVVNVADGTRLFERRTDDAEITQLCFSDDGQRLVSISVLSDGRQSIRVCDANTGSHLYSMLGGAGDACGAAVHPLSGELVVCGQETRAWSLGGARWILSRGGAEASVAFWGADDLVLAPTKKTNAALIQLQDPAPVMRWAYETANYRIPSVSGDGRLAALGWAVKPGVPFVVLKRNGEKVEEVLRMTPAAMPHLLRLSPSGSRIAVVCSFIDMIDLVDVASGTRPVTFEWRGESKPLDCAWVGEDRMLALVAFGKKSSTQNPVPQIERWDTTSGELIRTETNSSAMTRLVVASDRRHFAEAGTDKNVRIRDASTLAVVREFRVHDGPVTALAWHPTLNVIATASTDLTIRLWDVETGRKLLGLRGPLAAPHTLDFSPGGHRLGCAAIDGFSRIWEPDLLRDMPAAPEGE